MAPQIMSRARTTAVRQVGRRPEHRRRGRAPGIDAATTPNELIALLRLADDAGRQEITERLQHGAGNHVVQDIVARQPTLTAPLTDTQQWDKDWNDHPDHQADFAGSDRPSGSARHRYDVLCPLYKAHGIPRPMVYVATSVDTVTFFGTRATKAHSALRSALVTAEATLRGKGITSAPFGKMWAFNPRTTSEGNWSNHADGKAVDFDEDTNVRLSDKKQRKIISLVTGTDMGKSNQGYDAMKGASDRFKADYNATGMHRRVTELQAVETTRTSERDALKVARDALDAQRSTLQANRNSLASELRSVPTGRRASADDAQRAKDLKAQIKQADADLKVLKGQITAKKAELKIKESELKHATDDRKLLDKHLAAYEATDKAIADLETSVGSLPTEISTLNTQIDKTKVDEAEARKDGNSSGVKAQQRLRATLQKAVKAKTSELKKDRARLAKKTKQRDENTLRRYAKTGFLTLSKVFVEAMTAAGMFWGGEWGEANSKDFMHFQV
jgi:hypothetical protein